MKTLTTILLLITLSFAAKSQNSKTVYTVYFTPEVKQVADKADTLNVYPVHEYVRFKLHRGEEPLTMIAATKDNRYEFKLTYIEGEKEKLCFFEDGKLKIFY